MEDFRYAIWVFFFAIIWGVFFLARPDLRKQSVIIGLFVAFLTPLVGWWYLNDYWSPVFTWEVRFWELRSGIDEILLGFFLGAVGSIGYEVLFRKSPEGAPQSRKSFSFAFPIVAFSMLYGVGAGLAVFTGINSIYASLISFALAIAGLSFLRKDLVWGGFMSGIVSSLTLFLSYVLWLEVIFPGTIKEWWYLGNISGVLILGVPIEEILWGFAWGWVAGMLYEVWKGLEFVKHV